MKKIVNILFLVALAFSGAFACDSCEAFVIWGAVFFISVYGIFMGVKSFGSEEEAEEYAEKHNAGIDK